MSDTGERNQNFAGAAFFRGAGQNGH